MVGGVEHGAQASTQTILLCYGLIWHIPVEFIFVKMALVSPRNIVCSDDSIIMQSCGNGQRVSFGNNVKDTNKDGIFLCMPKMKYNCTFTFDLGISNNEPDIIVVSPLVFHL